MTIYTRPITHRPTRDGQTVTDLHVPFYLALEVNAGAYTQAMLDVANGFIDPYDLAVVSVSSTFRTELLVGEAQFDVQLQKVGNSSLIWAVEICQAGRSAASITTVLSQVGGDRTHSLAFSAEQRAALEPLLSA